MGKPAPARFFARALVRGRLRVGEFRIAAGRLIRRRPRWFRAVEGPLLGGLIGLVGGIAGLLIGLLLGYLLKELFSRAVINRKILDYFENPKAQKFPEGEPGLAAWCALGALIASEAPFPGNVPGASRAAETGEDLPAFGLFEEAIIKKTALAASRAFTGPGAEPALIELFVRLALSCRDKLNPDLLAESLAARRAAPGTRAGRRPPGKTGDLGLALLSLAENEKALRLAREIRRIVDPAPGGEKKPPHSASETLRDPWKILGLPPGTSLKEVKAHYRRLAKQFHPDELQILDENRRETAARAFMAIKEAYQQLSGGR